MVVNEDIRNCIQKHIKNSCLQVKVVPNSSKEELIEDKGLLKMYLKAVPDKEKANKELIKYFKKELGLHVEIKLGAHSREKVLRILE